MIPTLVYLNKTYTKGFTLVEMAVVLVIIGLIIGAAIVPLQAQRDINNYRETENSLAVIREALMGFAVINGRLPCPATVADPANINYGVEISPCTSSATAEGYLPWKTLGLTEVDSWSARRTQAADPWNGYWRYRVDRNFSSVFTMASTSGADALTVRNNAGNTLTTATERPIAIVFSAGKNLVPDGENADYEATNGVYEFNEQQNNFDDQVTWLSRPVLINRMVAAAKLP